MSGPEGGKYEQKAKSIALRITGELKEEIEKEKLEKSGRGDMQGFEEISRLNERIMGLEDAKRYIENARIETGSGRREAFVELIHCVKNEWVLAARGRGLEYRQSAIKLLEALAAEYEKMEKHPGVELFTFREEGNDEDT